MNEITYAKYNDTKIAVRCNREKFQDFMKTIDGRWNPRLKEGPGFLVPIENEEKLQLFINSKKDLNLDNIASIKKSRKNQQKYKRAISKREEEDKDIVEEVVETIIEKPIENPKKEHNEETNQEIKSEDREEHNNDTTHNLKREDKLKNKEDEDEEEEDEEEDEKDEDVVYDIPKNIVNILEEKRKNQNYKERTEEKIKKIQNNKDELSFYKNFSKKPQEFKKHYKSNKHISSSSSEYSDDESSDDYPSPETPKPRKSYKKESEDDVAELKQKIKDMQKRMYMMELENKKRK
jgi:hypothetical protein